MDNIGRAEQVLRIVTFSVLLMAGGWYLASTTVWQIVNLRGQAINISQDLQSCQVELKETNRLLQMARKEG